MPLRDILVSLAVAALIAVTLHGCGGSSGPQPTLSAADIALKFFHCCETGKGWAGCSQHVMDEKTPFNIQAKHALLGTGAHLNITSVKDYLDGMSGMVSEFGPKAKYELRANIYDSDTNIALFYALSMGFSDYVYVIHMDPKEKKVSAMTKVWNDQYATNHTPGALGRALPWPHCVVVPGHRKQAFAGSAHEFFDCCENGKGWAGCSKFVTDENATFSVQAVDALPGPKVTDIKTVKNYLDFMADLVKEFGPKATHTVKAQGFDSTTNTAMYYAVFMGYSEYVYNIKIDPNADHKVGSTTSRLAQRRIHSIKVDPKVNAVIKVWNDQYAKDHMPSSNEAALVV